jgi:hypothetical protein
MAVSTLPGCLKPRPGKKAVEDRNAAILARWNQPGAAGFFAWLDDIKPRILGRSSRYEPVALEPWQSDFIRDALEPGQDKPFKHSIVLHVTPRRHRQEHDLRLVILCCSRAGKT